MECEYVSSITIQRVIFANNLIYTAVELTQNYMRFILNLLRDPDNTAGVLIHCISGMNGQHFDQIWPNVILTTHVYLGWDRTPLWVSLLRILLWADGQIHKNLSADQMLYLTIAYDWLLFGYVHFFFV